MTDIQEQIAENRRQTNQQIEKVRENGHLSDEGKKAQIKQIYETGMENHQALEAKYHEGREKQRETTHEELFGPRFSAFTPDYQKASAKREYRLSLTEADKTLTGNGEEFNVEGLLRYLEMADLSQDDLAARAAFTIANNKGVKPVIDRYLGRRPELQEKYEDYRTLDQEMTNPTADQKAKEIFGGGLIPPVRPEEVRDHRDNPMSDIFGVGR